MKVQHHLSCLRHSIICLFCKHTNLQVQQYFCLKRHEAKNGIHRFCLMTQVSKEYRILYLWIRKTTVFLTHHLKKDSHFIIAHKVKHVVCTYFSDNWRLRGSGTIYIVSCYIQVNIASIDSLSMLCKLLCNHSQLNSRLKKLDSYN